MCTIQGDLSHKGRFFLHNTEDYLDVTLVNLEAIGGDYFWWMAHDEEGFFHFWKRKDQVDSEIVCLVGVPGADAYAFADASVVPALIHEATQQPHIISYLILGYPPAEAKELAEKKAEALAAVRQEIQQREEARAVQQEVLNPDPGGLSADDLDLSLDDLDL